MNCYPKFLFGMLIILAPFLYISCDTNKENKKSENEQPSNTEEATIKTFYEWEGKYIDSDGDELNVHADRFGGLEVQSGQFMPVESGIIGGNVFIRNYRATLTEEGILLNTGNGTILYMRVNSSEDKNETMNSNLESNNNGSSELENQNDNQLMKIRDVKLHFLDASLNKVKSILGPPDKENYLYSDATSGKIAVIYLNKVLDENNSVKHLVFLIREINYPETIVREIHAVGNNEKVYYGIHYIVISNGKISSNSGMF